MKIIKHVLPIVLSLLLVFNSTAISYASLQSENIRDMLAFGDIVISDSPLDGFYYPINNIESINAGEPLTIGLFIVTAAAIAFAYENVNVTSDKVQLQQQVLALELSKYDSLDAQKTRFLELGYTDDQWSEAYEVAEQELGVTGLGIAVGGLTGGAISIFGGVASSWSISKNNQAIIELLDRSYDLATTDAAVSAIESNPSDINAFVAASELVKGGEFAKSSDLGKWFALNAKSGYKSFGDIAAPVSSSDGRFGVIHTGVGDISDTGKLIQTVTAPKSSSAVFNVRYNFVTTEYPNFLGSEFNDSFSIKITDVTSGKTKTLASFSGALNNLFKEGDPIVENLPSNVLDGDTGGQTGWIVKSSDQIALKSGGKYRIYLDVRDVGDRVVDSALLIDKVSLR